MCRDVHKYSVLIYLCVCVCARERTRVCVCAYNIQHDEQEAPADERGRHVGRGTVGE